MFSGSAIMVRVRRVTAVFRCCASAIRSGEVGADNKYGYPNSDVMGRLAGEGIITFRTDKDGTVTLCSDGERLYMVGSK